MENCEVTPIQPIQTPQTTNQTNRADTPPTHTPDGGPPGQPVVMSKKAVKRR